MQPLVSICIPSYRHAALLERALQSVTKQDYKNVEVIISDDTPGDDVKILAEKYSTQLQLHYYHNTPSLGTPVNWNAALDKGSGDLLMLLHHDDWLANSSSISHSVQLFTQHPEASVLFGRSMAIDKLVTDTSLFPSSYFKQFYNKPIKLLLNNVIGPPSNVIIRKDVKQRYDIFYKWLVDLEFYIQLLNAGRRFIYLDERLISVGVHDGQMTNYVQQNQEIMLKENVYFCNQYIKRLGLKIYDHLWRLVRNNNIRSKDDLLQIGVPGNAIPKYVEHMIQAQSEINAATLKNGFVSKVYMLLNFVKAPSR